MLNKKRGTATLLLQVPGPGALRLTGKGIKPAKRLARKAGRARLPVIPVGKAKRTLAKRGVLRVRAKVTFVPTGGTAASRVKPLRLRKSASTLR